MLVKKSTTEDEEVPKINAVILSWGIYGASVEWKRNGMSIPPEDFIKPSIPYLLSGVDYGSKN
ncbi:hypothetical protein QFZ31_000065 [Neobacillus niacini]|nr:hypothetical protein [Neobacillus niacini]